MNSKKIFLLALLFPFIALLLLTFYKAYSLQSGLRFILPISGYDPINPIAGHYVTYQVEYGPMTCEGVDPKAKEESCICLSLAHDNHYFLPTCEEREIKRCDAYLRGKCRYGRFEAGIEEYFIPEEKAKSIDETIRKGKSKIKISVQKNGTALVEDLILVED
ncbi:MAG TPA: GDYXXLXY domain-containing protein [Leptospiraceae bacterium]|nr:GDYXXLXY domain-containing protein [Leptospiraceae bacterium]HMW06670.1 GDYXXLXY domain-containing protein [Leptospiraceae bacterium]HMX34114.1 GDYXXLXY domain-containing protein [Leptospiraceae bacterium]HMY33721.1 GDYXXLXY domain-containing protein [Leptospiraceae bacterium]HMZ64934.1 GDYXXLXY domain-containing protein [Leptospiraceae bacterium]